MLFSTSQNILFILSAPACLLFSLIACLPILFVCLPAGLSFSVTLTSLDAEMLIRALDHARKCSHLIRT